jgi:hypothetical protein
MRTSACQPRKHTEQILLRAVSRAESRRNRHHLVPLWERLNDFHIKFVHFTTGSTTHDVVLDPRAAADFPLGESRVWSDDDFEEEDEAA